MEDRIGQRLSNYQLLRLLGRGGFAEVHLGEHTHLGTHAAVKVLYTRLANPDEVENFQKEARPIAHLDHPHIVRVFDFDVVNDTPFLVMSYAAGGTLRQRHPTCTYRGHSFVVSAVAWSPDGKRIASTSKDKSVQVWDAATGKNLFTYKGHSKGVLAEVWSPDGKYIASASNNRTVQVWQAG